MENGKERIENRIIYLDFLRIFAVIGVIAIHVTATHWYTEPVGTFNWIILNSYNKAVGGAVPLFLMISGAVWFSKEKNVGVHVIWNRYIFRIVIAFLFWSLMYTCLHVILFPDVAGGFSIGHFVATWLRGRYHLWFCYLIIGIYMLYPVLYQAMREEFILKYFLFLLFLFLFIIPDIQQWSFFQWTKAITDDINFSVCSKYLFYFICGYFLHKKDFQRWEIKLIYIVGLVMQVYLVVGSDMIGIKEITEFSLPFASVCDAGRNISLFLLCKQFLDVKYENEKIKKIVSLSDKVFGIYLIHDFFVWGLDRWGIQTVSFNPIFSVPFIVILCFIMSVIGVNILSRIPIVKEWLI